MSIALPRCVVSHRALAGALLLGTALTAANALGATLGLGKTPSVTTVESGVQFTYTLDYTCFSQTENCRDVVLTDTLPTTLDPNNVTLVGSADTLSESFANGVATFDFGPELAAGSPGQVQIIVSFPNGSTPNGATAINSASIQGSNASAVFATADTVTATAEASWSIDKALKVSDPAPALDQEVLYTISIEDNSGDGGLDLENALVTDILPAGAQFVSASDNGTQSDGVVTWDLGTLTGDKTLSLALRYPSSHFALTDLVTNQVVLVGDPIGEDGIVLEDQVEHGFDGPTPGIGNFDKAGGGTAGVGDSKAFRIEFLNNGNQPYHTLTIEDVIPGSLDLRQIKTGSQDSLSAPSDRDCPVISRVGEKGVAMAIQYKSRDVTSYTDLPGSPYCTGSSTTTVNTSGFLAGDDYITHIRWVLSDVPPGFDMRSNSTVPTLVVDVLDTDRNTLAVVQAGERIVNTATYVAQINGSPDLTGSNGAAIDVIGDSPRPRIDKYVQSADTVAPSGTVTYRVQLTNNSDPGAALTDFTITDLLDANLAYVEGSWSWAETLPNVEVAFTATKNYRGTGRTLLRWDFTGTMGFWDRTRIDYDVLVKAGTLAGTLKNTANLASPNADALNSSACRQRVADVNDLNDNGDTGESLCTSRANDGDITIVESASLSSEIQVIGQLDQGYSKFPDTGETVPGGNLLYKVSVTNTGNIPMTDIVIVDVAPYIGDSGTIDLSDRGSTWRPFLIAPIIPPAGITILYSTSTNPCRGDMNPDNPDPNVPWPLAGDYPAGASNPRDCEDPQWSTIAPDDITTVQAYRFEFNEIVLSPRDSLEFSGYMQIPQVTEDVVDGSLAWNSFGFAATRTDNGVRLLPAEPLKVGISLTAPLPAEYGDYVWVDGNGNGIQDEDPSSGLNGVRVELYRDNGNGVADPATDTLVGFRLTANNLAGDPGHYQFTDLPGGDYFARFIRPNGYTITALNAAGSTSETDSDADLSTGLTPITTLRIGDVDRSWALGVQESTTATVGDYVWFDRNGDGLQNEPVLDGINGVTVTLREAASPDVIVRTTSTGDDISGRPGYYQFDGLTASVAHILQFELPTMGSNGFTTQKAGTLVNADSDANSVTGRTGSFQLTAGAFDSGLDAGVVLEKGTFSLSNWIWHDTNENGVYDYDEEGVNGVRLNLYRDDGDGLFGDGDEYYTATETFTSGVPGYYEFINLPEGDYVVVVDPSSLGNDGPLQDYTPTDNVIVEGWVDPNAPVWFDPGWYFHFNTRIGTSVYSANHDADGIPLDLDPTIYALDQALLDRIALTLPEGQDIRVHGGNLIAEPEAGIIDLQDSADLWITFIHEGTNTRDAVGYYTYPAGNPPRSANDIGHVVMLPNSSFSSDGGNERGMESGHRIHLGHFHPDTKIGFFVVADGFAPNDGGVDEGLLGSTFYSHSDFNPPEDADLRTHLVLVKDHESGSLVLGIEDVSRSSQSSDHDFNDLLFLIEVDPVDAVGTDAIAGLKDANDDDGDGVANAEDSAPDDPDRAIEVSYPGGGEYASVAFEDNWPWRGDYDMNDLVLGYRATETRDAVGDVKELLVEFEIRARSSSYSHEFGLFFQNLLPGDLESAEVWVIPGEVGISGAIAPFSIGPEQGVSNGLSLMILDNNYDLGGNYYSNSAYNGTRMSTTGLVSTNTCGRRYFNGWTDCVQQGPTFFLKAVFTDPVSPALLGEPPYNPFIAIDVAYGRSRETHLPTMPPTNLINRFLFANARYDDDSDRDAFNPYVPHPQQGRYFLNRDNMPWAVHIPVDWRPPMEKISIAPLADLYLDSPTNSILDPQRDPCVQPRANDYEPRAAAGVAYPRFSDCWTRSGKALDADWYLHPVDGLVLPSTR